MYLKCLNQKDLEGSCRYLFEVIIKNFPGGTKETYEKPQSGKSVSLPRFEMRIS